MPTSTGGAGGCGDVAIGHAATVQVALADAWRHAAGTADGGPGLQLATGGGRSECGDDEGSSGSDKGAASGGPYACEPEDTR